MDSNSIKISIQKTANSVKMAAFLSLATILYQVYVYTKAPGGPIQLISIALGFVGTILIWQLGKELRAGRKQAMYYWIALILVGYSRWLFIDATFTINIASMLVLLFTLIFTLRLVGWIRNKALV